MLAALAAGGGSGPQQATPPATRPAEVVRIVRGEAVEQGRSMAEVYSRTAIIPNPVYRGWALWGVGTRIVARVDEIDAQGRNFPVRREARRLDALTGDSATVVLLPIQSDGSAGQATQQVVPAQAERGSLLLMRQGPQMLYWRRYDARVALERPAMQPAAEDRSARRQRREARQAVEIQAPRDALPAEFDCTIIETVHLLVEDDAANDNPALAKVGDPLTVIRSYHTVEAPGWEVMVETYRARLGEDGFAAELELLWRWRIEWILRPGEPDPPPEKLREGLPLGG
jgi:hypothetical protein